MKTFSTDGRIPLCVVLHDDAEPSSPHEAYAEDPQSPEEHAWHADTAEALSAWARPRFVTLPGREPTDLESISDLWLD